MSLDYSFPLSTSDSSDSKALQDFLMLSTVTSSTNANQIHHFVSEKDDEYWSIDMLTFGHNGVIAALNNDTLNSGVVETPASLVQGGTSSLSPSSKLSSFSSTSLLNQQSFPSSSTTKTTMKSVTSTTSANRFASNTTTMIEQQAYHMLSPSSSVVGSVDEDKRTKSREVARLRRMKKQNEAISLTKEMAQLMFEYECFEHACETTITLPVERMIMLQQVSILSETTNDIRGAAMTCAVCGGKFFSEKDIVNHLIESHSLESSKMSGEDTDDDNDDDDDNNSNTKKSSSNAVLDKKRRRQERNAISARLSRQRKKLYILLLQTQIPVLRARLDRIRLCIPPYALKTALSLISKGGPATFPYGGNLFPYELVSKLLMPSSEKMRMCSSFVSRKANYIPPTASFINDNKNNCDVNAFDAAQPLAKKVQRSVSTSISSPILTEVSDCDDIALIQDQQQVNPFPECIASGLLVDESCFSFDITSVFSNEVDSCNTVAAPSSCGMCLKREREDGSLLVV